MRTILRVVLVLQLAFLPISYSATPSNIQAAVQSSEDFIHAQQTVGTLLFSLEQMYPSPDWKLIRAEYSSRIIDPLPRVRSNGFEIIVEERDRSPVSLSPVDIENRIFVINGQRIKFSADTSAKKALEVINLALQKRHVGVRFFSEAQAIVLVLGAVVLLGALYYMSCSFNPKCVSPFPKAGSQLDAIGIEANRYSAYTRSYSELKCSDEKKSDTKKNQCDQIRNSAVDSCKKLQEFAKQDKAKPVFFFETFEKKMLVTSLDFPKRDCAIIEALQFVSNVEGVSRSGAKDSSSSKSGLR